VSDPIKPGVDWPYFVLLCTEEELRRHLTTCRNSEYRVAEEVATGSLSVHDGDTALLRAERGAMGWMAFLHRQYYRHPFQPASRSGEALPGVP